MVVGAGKALMVVDHGLWVCGCLSSSLVYLPWHPSFGQVILRGNRRVSHHTPSPEYLGLSQYIHRGTEAHITYRKFRGAGPQFLSGNNRGRPLTRPRTGGWL